MGGGFICPLSPLPNTYSFTGVMISWLVSCSVKMNLFLCLVFGFAVCFSCHFDCPSTDDWFRPLCAVMLFFLLAIFPFLILKIDFFVLFILHINFNYLFKYFHVFCSAGTMWLESTGCTSILEWCYVINVLLLSIYVIAFHRTVDRLVSLRTEYFCPERVSVWVYFFAKICGFFFCYFTHLSPFSVVEQPKSDLAPLIFEVSKSHTFRHTNSEGRSLHKTQQTQETNIHALIEIRNSCSQQSRGCRPTP